jgi:hypothetical protein
MVTLAALLVDLLNTILIRVSPLALNLHTYRRLMSGTIR